MLMEGTADGGDKPSWKNFSGAMIRHGWHHPAQKSTTTGRFFDSSMTDATNVSSVTSTIMASAPSSPGMIQE